MSHIVIHVTPFHLHVASCARCIVLSVIAAQLVCGFRMPMWVTNLANHGVVCGLPAWLTIQYPDLMCVSA